MDWRLTLAVAAGRVIWNWMKHEGDLQKLKENPIKVFLAYAWEDRPVTQELYARLKVQPGVKPWMDDSELSPGEDWDSTIRESISDAEVALVCLSPTAVQKLASSSYLRQEVEWIAERAGRVQGNAAKTFFVIPVKLEPCEVPSIVAFWQWAELYESRGYDKLLELMVEKAKIMNSIPDSMVTANTT